MKHQILLKTPINYYGSKVMMLPKILPYIPEHKVYTEVFLGGASLFFAKEPAKIEILNDINGNVVNFYKIAKKQFESLKTEIDSTLYSEQEFKEARQLYKTSTEKESVMRAWGFFVACNQSFMNNPESSWSYSSGKNAATTFQNKKERFDERYVKRLEHVQVFCRDAVKCLQNTNVENAFHFVDPPYFNADMGPYSGYTEADFERLLIQLESTTGKFLLTTYPSDILKKYTEKNGWHTVEFILPNSASRVGKGEKMRMKTEVFTFNYKVSQEILNAFSKDN
jgi:DNA adenine methylase